MATILEVENHYVNRIKNICEELFNNSYDDYSDEEICSKLFIYNEETEEMRYADINGISDSFGYLVCYTFNN
jgi:hypothetical protein